MSLTLAKKASKNVSPSLFAFGTKCILQVHCVLSNLLLKDLFSHLLNHGQSSYWTAKSSFLFFLASDHTEADPNYTLVVDFWTTIFYNLKNSGYDLSNEGSNFILSLLEVGH